MREHFIRSAVCAVYILRKILTRIALLDVDTSKYNLLRFALRLRDVDTFTQAKQAAVPCRVEIPMRVYISGKQAAAPGRVEILTRVNISGKQAAALGLVVQAPAIRKSTRGRIL